MVVTEDCRKVPGDHVEPLETSPQRESNMRAILLLAELTDGVVPPANGVSQVWSRNEGQEKWISHQGRNTWSLIPTKKSMTDLSPRRGREKIVQ